MHRHLFWFVFLGISLPALVPPPSAGQEPPKESRKIYVEVCVAEISVTKLKNLGLDWDVFVKNADSSAGDKDQAEDEPTDTIKFVRALAQSDLAQILAHPRLATLSGRPASLVLGDAIKLNVNPQVTEKGWIRLEYEIRVSQPLPADKKITVTPPLNVPQGKRELASSASVELEPGHTVCVAGPLPYQVAIGQSKREVSAVVLIRADFKPPDDIRTAERELPERPVLDGYDRELPRR